MYQVFDAWQVIVAISNKKRLKTSYYLYHLLRIYLDGVSFTLGTNK